MVDYEPSPVRLKPPAVCKTHDEGVQELFEQRLVWHVAPDGREGLEEAGKAGRGLDPLARAPARPQEYHERPVRHQVRDNAFRDGLEV